MLLTSVSKLRNVGARSQWYRTRPVRQASLDANDKFIAAVEIWMSKMIETGGGGLLYFARFPSWTSATGYRIRYKISWRST